jgi:hypothetical protein
MGYNAFCLLILVSFPFFLPTYSMLPMRTSTIWHVLLFWFLDDIFVLFCSASDMIILLFFSFLFLLLPLWKTTCFSTKEF